MSIAKTKKQVNTYQPQYEPPNLTDAEQKRVESLTDSRLCNAEVDRVARNIANAVTNPDTPEKVRDYIKAYLDDHLHFDWTETPEAILCMFPIACRKISHTPFVPQKPYIEALTGKSKKRAIEATKEDHDIEPHKSITPERVSRLVETLMNLDGDDDELKAAVLIALVDGIGNEPNPSLRNRLAVEAFHCAYSYAVRYSEQEEAFIAKAIKEHSK